MKLTQDGKAVLLTREGLKRIEYNEFQKCPNCSTAMIPCTYVETQDVYVCYKKDCLEKIWGEFLSKFYSGKITTVYPCGFYFFMQDRMKFRDVCLWNLDDDVKFMKTIWEMGKIQGYLKKGMMLTGGVGTGKTHVIFSCIRDLFMSGAIDIAYVSEEQFFSDLKKAINERHNSAEHVIDKIKHSKYLFYDDLGAATKSWENEWAKQVLMEIVNYRYENELPIFMTSNLPIENQENIVGPRIFDRLNCFHYVTLKGESKRKRPKII